MAHFKYYENDYELAVLELLESCGWEYRCGYDIHREKDDRDTLRVECKSAVFHADFLLLRLSRFGNSTGSDASSRVASSGSSTLPMKL